MLPGICRGSTPRTFSEMDWEAIKAAAAAFLLASNDNAVRAEDAMREDLIGMRIFDAPLFAVGGAGDPLFEALRDPQAVHPKYRLPSEWVAGARSVVSFFAPYTECVRQANAADFRHPADEWLHARYEGEMMMQKLRLHLRGALRRNGYQAVAPVHDEAYAMAGRYAPNWSERHTGWICGLGTFGLSKGLITAKGVAGRLGSIVTDCALPITPRAYEDRYAHCIRCGACAKHCPARAIDPARGMDNAKAHPPCDAFLEHVRGFPPRGASGRERYGCGKCQVAVPCEQSVPQ